MKCCQSLVTILLLPVLGALVGTQEQLCYVPGRCVGNSLGKATTQDAVDCLEYCRDDVSSCAWWSFNRDTFICDTLTSCSLNAQSTSWESGASTCQDSDDGDCLQNGSCVGTIVESDTDIVTSDECLSLCHNNPNCQYFTWRSDTNLCALYEDCVVDNSTCEDCVSGTRDCLICEGNGECGGDSTLVGADSGNTETYETCKEFCRSTFGCLYFTFYSVGKSCLIYRNCFYNVGCPDCFTGQPDCPEPAPQGQDTKILIALGRDNMRDVEILALPSQLNEPDRTVCEKPEDYPIRTETAVAAVVEGKVTLCGGITGSETYSDCKLLNPDNNRWEYFKAMQRKRGFASSVYVPNKGWWVLGGFDLNVHVTTEYFDEINDLWVYGPTLPLPIYGHCSVQVGTKTFIVGGDSENSDLYLKSAYVYDEAEDTPGWRRLQDMTTGREAPACGLYMDSTIVVAGGYTSLGDTSAVEVFDIGTERWSDGPTLPFSTAGAALVHDGEQDLLLVGGDAVDVVYSYAPDGWTQVPDLRLQVKTRRYAPVLTVSDEVLSGCSNV